VRCFSHALELFRETCDKETVELYEECKLMLLNRANKALGTNDGHYSLADNGYIQ